MSNQILPILSGSLEEIIRSIVIKTDDPIATEILKAHQYVEQYNCVCYGFGDALSSEILDKIINQIVTDEIRMISVRIGDFEVSFLPKGKDPEYTPNHNWSKKNRQTGKPARIFQKLLKKEFKTREWEIFTNLFKAELCQCAEFKIVQGEDIRYWYNENNYYKCEGTLGNSCMRYEHAQDYFDIYVDKAKMLITTKDGLLTGRALVWEVDGVTLLDRIYTCYDYLENCFIDYAREQGWWFRESNSLLSTGDDQGWYSPDDNYESVTYREFKVHLDRRYEYFPYVDSFRYFDGDRIISTHCHCSYLSLDSTDGDFRGESYVCDNCGDVFYGYDDEMPDGLHYSNWSDAYYCDNCCWYSNGLDDYIPNSEDSRYVITKWSESLTYPVSYVEENFVSDPDGTETRDNIVRIGNKYYFVSDRIEFNEETRQYEVRSSSS